MKPGLRAFTCRAEPLFYEARTPSPGEVRSLSQQITGVKTSSAPRVKVDVGINILDHQLVIRCSYHLTRSLFVHRRGPTPPQRTAEILRRKPTRIELKPDDREEYFAQKNKGKQPEQADSKDAKQSEKDTRIGIVRPR